MLDTESFIARLAQEGYTHFCVVPCSFAKSLINASMNDADRIEYLPCASEAVACSVAAGLKMSGRKPIVIAQSSGLTNMGSCITSLLKPYEIRLPIIVSWRTYQAGDSEVQHAHLSTYLPELVEAYGYRYAVLDRENENIAVEQIRQCEESDQICLLEQKTFSAVELKDALKLDLSDFPKRSDYLKTLNQKFAGTDAVFIGTTGNTAREMHTFQSDTKNFYMAGNMGGALSVGLGSALAGNRTVVCGGDAEFVMHMGALTTAARYSHRGIKLCYLVFDNASNKSTGGQQTLQAHVDYRLIAQASGLASYPRPIESLDEFDKALASNIAVSGVSMFHIRCSYDDDVERPSAEVIVNSKRVFL